MSEVSGNTLPRHPVLVKATERTQRASSLDPESFWSRLHGWVVDSVTLTEVIDALVEVDRELTTADLSPLNRAELAADFKDLTSLLGFIEHRVHAWAVVTTYDPEGGFRPGRDVVWAGYLDKADAETALPLWDQSLNRPKDNIRVEWRTDVGVSQLRTGPKGPR